jgi:uncharacterized protein (TIGR00730 family)
MLQLLYGIWRISAHPTPFVSIFGGARFKQDDYYAVMARELAKKLVNVNISVLTGGGLGIMEAANRGAVSAKQGNGRSIGIWVRDLNEPRNRYVEEFIVLKQFWARKWLLTNYSSAFIIFPGGYGTLDELAEVLTQTKKHPAKLIILVGKNYWKPFITWSVEEAFHNGLVTQADIDLFVITDDLDHIFKRVTEACAPAVKTT